MEFIIRFANIPIGENAKHPVEARYLEDSLRRPCKAAYQKPQNLLEDYRGYYPDYPELRFYPQFLATGINHRIEGSRLVRDIPDPRYYINIETVSDIVALEAEVERPITFSFGQIIIDNTIQNNMAFVHYQPSWTNDL